MHRPVLGKHGSFLFELLVEFLELTSIILGFYAILHTSSAPLIEAEMDPELESRLMVQLAVSTRGFVVAAISIFASVFLLRTVVSRFIQFTPYR
jgi:hypothetical protein